jgi:hypothetical protein
MTTRIELPPAGRIKEDGAGRRGGPKVMWKALVSFRYADDYGEHEIEAGKTFVAPGHPLTRRWPGRFLPVNMREERKAARARRPARVARTAETERLREIIGPPRPRGTWRLPDPPREIWRLP